MRDQYREEFELVSVESRVNKLSLVDVNIDVYRIGDANLDESALALRAIGKFSYYKCWFQKGKDCNSVEALHS